MNPQVLLPQKRILHPRLRGTGQKGKHRPYTEGGKEKEKTNSVM